MMAFLILVSQNVKMTLCTFISICCFYFFATWREERIAAKKERKEQQKQKVSDDADITDFLDHM